MNPRFFLSLLLLTALRPLPLGGSEPPLPSALSAPDIHASRLREQNRQLERDLRLHDGAGSPVSAQIHARAQRVNRLSGYFSPQGINVFDAYETGRAVETDQIRRRENLLRLTDALAQKVMSLEGKKAEAASAVVDAGSGRWTTYDKGALRDASSRLENLAREAEGMEEYVRGDFGTNYRANALNPYEDRELHLQNLRQAGALADYFTGGQPGGFYGIAGLKASLRQTSDGFLGMAKRVEDQEEAMRGNAAANYILNGTVLLTQALLAVPSGGASFAAGAALAGNALSLAQSARTHVILNQKGLEGLRSGAEQDASLGVESFQRSLSVFSMVSAAVSSARSRGPIQALSQSDVLYKNFQRLQKGISFLEKTGIADSWIGPENRLYLDAGLAAGRLGFRVAGTGRWQTEIRMEQGLARYEATRDLAPLQTAGRNFLAAQETLADGLTVIQTLESGRRFVLENRGPLAWTGRAAEMASTALRGTVARQLSSPARVESLLLEKYGEDRVWGPQIPDEVQGFEIYRDTLYHRAKVARFHQTEVRPVFYSGMEYNPAAEQYQLVKKTFWPAPTGDYNPSLKALRYDTAIGVLTQPETIYSREGWQERTDGKPFPLYPQNRASRVSSDIVELLYIAQPFEETRLKDMKRTFRYIEKRGDIPEDKRAEFALQRTAPYQFYSRAGSISKYGYYRNGVWHIETGIQDIRENLRQRPELSWTPREKKN